jgi:hypothetical protein
METGHADCCFIGSAGGQAQEDKEKKAKVIEERSL